jgi:hypothetical protein
VKEPIKARFSPDALGFAHDRNRGPVMPISRDQTTIGDLRTQIAARIQSSQLPRAGEQKLFAGFGDNETCDCCGTPVAKGEVLYEVEVTREFAAPVVLVMHRACFKLWSEESQRGLEVDDALSRFG